MRKYHKRQKQVWWCDGAMGLKSNLCFHPKQSCSSKGIKQKLINDGNKLWNIRTWSNKLLHVHSTLNNKLSFHKMSKKREMQKKNRIFPITPSPSFCAQSYHIYFWKSPKNWITKKQMFFLKKTTRNSIASVLIFYSLLWLRKK